MRWIRRNLLLLIITFAALFALARVARPLLG